MSTSFIEYHEKGFWINDFIIELAIEYLVINLSSTKIELWVDDYIIEKLIPISKGYFPGYIHLGFEEYLHEADKLGFLIKEIDKTMDLVYGRGDFISTEELNSFVVNENLQVKSSRPFPIHPIIETLKRLKQLLQGIQPSQNEITI